MAAERIAVVGAGLMGHGIAQVFAAAGHTVSVTDEDPAVLASAPGRIRDNLERLGVDPSPAEAIRLCTGLEAAVADADVVFEAAPERLELKRGLFERISRCVSPHALLATNTSVIAVGEIAAQAVEPGRVVGTHWWNPPYLIPLVEVTQAAATSADTIDRTIALLERAGKAPIHVRRDIPGFIGNRLQHALWREAFALVAAGVCDAESLDRVVKTSFGPRLAVLGPMENADLVGLDLTLDIHDYLLPHLDTSADPSPRLRELVEQGELGMKTGAGFRRWSDEEARETRERLFDHLAATTTSRQELA